MSKVNKRLLIFLFLGLLYMLVASALLHASTTSPPIINSSSNNLSFSKAEQHWLAQNHLVRVRVGDYAPIQFFDKKPTGIAVDYLNIIAEKTGIQIEYLMGVSWGDALKKMQDRNGIDLLLGAVSTKERRNYLAFTDNYLSFPSVIFTQEDSEFISSLKDLSGKVVSVQNKVVVHDLLVKQYPDVRLLPKDTVEEALRSLVTRESDAYVGNLTVGSYYILTNGWNNIKVAAPTGFDPQSLAMAVRSDWPELAQIINKVLTTITPAEHATLRSQWSTPIRYEYGISGLDVLKLVGGVSSLLTVIIAIILWWNKRLSKEVDARTIAEKKLTKSKEKYRGLYENNPLPYQSLNEDGYILDVNPTWLTSLGYQREEVIGKHYTGFLHAESQQIFHQNFPKFKQNGCATGVEFQLVHKDGHFLYISLNGSVGYKDDGSVDRYYCVFHDITESKLAEEEKVKLEMVNRQLHKNQSLNRMAGAIAHNFNNLLATVIGNIEIVIDELPQDTEPVKCLDEAMQGALKAAEVSRQMLTYLGQSSGKHKSLDLSELCLQTLPLLRAASPTGIMIKEYLPNPGPNITANANQIQQVLTNIITNACEAIGNNQGVIDLQVKTVSSSEIPAKNRFPIDWEPQDKTYACIQAVDSGCGIAAEDIANLFDPFFSTKFQGRGLGLTVAWGIVTAQGGTFTVESEVGRGSTFQVFIPMSAYEVPQQSEPKNSPFPTPETGGTVLLVEDDNKVLVMTERILIRNGFKVITAEHGVQALEIFKKQSHKINVVLCDLNMPHMGGWETLAALRLINPSLPFIIVSGHDESHVFTEDHHELPQAFLHKPYQRSELLESLTKAMMGNVAKQ